LRGCVCEVVVAHRDARVAVEVDLVVVKHNLGPENIKRKGEMCLEDTIKRINGALQLLK